jgi:WD40 repeat protein
LFHIATGGQVQGLDLSPDGRGALAGLDNSQVLHLDLDAGGVLRTLKGHRGSVGWVGFAPDGKHAFSAAHDGTARLWDLTDGREVRQFRVQGKWANCGAVFPDGSRLLTGDDRGLLQVWDVATGQDIKRMEAGSVLCLSVLPGGRHALVAASDVSLWDLETGERLRVFKGHDSGVFQAALSPDGKQVVTASFDGTVRLWDFPTAELLRVVGNHEEFVFSAAFSPDGRLVASGGGGRREGKDYLPGSDHDIRLWDLAPAAPEEPPPPSGTKGWLVAAAILGLLALLAFLGAWLWARRGRAGKAPVPDEQARPAAAAAPIAFTCPGCGNGLKVKEALAGKKVRCPRCSEGVFVPPARA